MTARSNEATAAPVAGATSGVATAPPAVPAASGGETQTPPATATLTPSVTEGQQQTLARGPGGRFLAKPSPVVNVTPGDGSDAAASLTRARFKRGRPGKGDPRYKPRALNPPAEVITPAVFQSKVDYRGTAVLTVHSVTGLAETVFGPEWHPTENEDTALCDATEAYFRAKNIPDIPPGWMLLFVTLGYVTPRLNSENTARKLSTWKMKVVNAFRKKTT